MTEYLDSVRWTMIREEPVNLPFGKPIPTSIRGFMWSAELIHLNLTSETLRQRGVAGGVLEIGSYCGLSACALAQPGPLTCVDTFRDAWKPEDEHHYTRPEFDANMEMMGLSPRVMEGDSRDILPQLIEAGEKFRLILVDGGHSYKEAHPDLLNSKSLLSPGGVIVVDDATIGDILRAILDAGLNGVKVPQGKLLFAQPKEWSN